MGLRRAGSLPRGAATGGERLVLGGHRVCGAQPLGPAAGRGRAGSARQGLPPGRAAGLSCHLPTGGPRATSRRPPADRGQGSHASRAGRADRRRGRSRETGDRRSDRAAAGVRRVSGHRPGPRSRRDSRLQGSRASLPARSAPARGPPCGGGGGARASADAPRDGPGVPRAPAARRRLRPRRVRAARRRVPGARGPGWRGGGGGLMQLLRLRLVNFRQHADTELEFGPGITGIIGPNGSGKTTILEAIAWALYGAQAVRGDKDSIRRLGAKGRAGVEVDLEFRLGAHEYRVTRGLSTAALHQDGQVIANSLKAVTDKLERTLGMTHDEFFNTYFTGQKELAVMAALGKTERAAFLSRVLGYERLREAQERVREVRNAVAAEVRGLEAGLPDGAALAAARQAAEQRLAEARTAAKGVDAARRAAEDALGREEPRWNDWVTRRERTLSLDGERRMAEQAVASSRQEFQRLDKELADALAAREQLRLLGAELAPVARLKQEVAALGGLQRETAARRAEEAQLAELARAVRMLERRLTELGDVAEALARADAAARGLHERLETVERAAEPERTVWVRDRQYAETKRTELLKLYEEVKEQRDQIVRLGPEGTCPTCKRPLGPEYAGVLALLDAQPEVITGDGKYFRQRLEQLAQSPAKLLDAEAERDRVLEDSRSASARAGELRAQVEERDRASAELAGARRRAEPRRR